MLIGGSVQSQKYALKIDASDDTETQVLKSIQYREQHPDSSAARAELDTIASQLKLFGYLGNRPHNIESTDSVMTVNWRLGPKTESIRLSVRNDVRTQLADLNWEEYVEILPDGWIQLSFDRLPGFLQRLTDELESRGQSFAKVHLSEIQLDGNSARAILNVTFSQRRTIDKIVIRGYDNFPKNFVRHQLGLSVGEEFSRSDLDEASRALNELLFAEETRAPEVLFTQDSTLIYLYLKKSKSNRFDGIIGFASEEESSGLEFNGYLDLALNNIFNGGETIALYWKNNGNDRQRFYLQVETPFIFNSPLTPTLNFELFRQDSTFNNVSALLNLSYVLGSRSKVGASIRSVNSNDLKTLGNASITSF